MLIPEIDHCFVRFCFYECKENAMLVCVVIRKIISDPLSVGRINRVNVATSTVNPFDTHWRVNDLVIV